MFTIISIYLMFLEAKNKWLTWKDWLYFLLFMIVDIIDILIAFVILLKFFK